MNEKKGRKRINRKKKKEATGKVNLRNKNTVKEKDKIISENKEQTKKYTRRGKKRRNKTQVNSFSLNRCHNSREFLIRTIGHFLALALASASTPAIHRLGERSEKWRSPFFCRFYP